MQGFDTTQPIHARPDGSLEPGGLVVTYNDERVLLINEGSPWFNKGEEPEKLREAVWAFINEHGYNNVVTLEPTPEPPEPSEPPEPQPDTHGFILGLMGVEIDE